jgi:hypothetical protein
VLVVLHQVDLEQEGLLLDQMVLTHHLIHLLQLAVAAGLMAIQALV